MKKDNKVTLGERLGIFFSQTLRKNWGMRILSLIAAVLIVLVIGFVTQGA